LGCAISENDLLGCLIHCKMSVKADPTLHETSLARAAGAARGAYALLFVCLALAGCAGTVNPPTLTTAPTTKFDPATVGIGRVSAQAAPGVAMTSEDLTRISGLVQAELASTYPDRVIAAGGARRPGAVNVKLLFTQYDAGNAVARLMLAGLGQIHIAAKVLLTDMTTGRTVATFEASKTFAWGGLYGGSTQIGDVEVGFARSVAEIFQKH
jgi:hypothetical protein